MDDYSRMKVGTVVGVLVCVIAGWNFRDSALLSGVIGLVAGFAAFGSVTWLLQPPVKSDRDRPSVPPHHPKSEA